MKLYGIKCMSLALSRYQWEITWRGFTQPLSSGHFMTQGDDDDDTHNQNTNKLIVGTF